VPIVLDVACPVKTRRQMMRDEGKKISGKFQNVAKVIPTARNDDCRLLVMEWLFNLALPDYVTNFRR